MRLMGSHTNEYVDMVRHAIDLKHFMFVRLEYTRDVLMESLFPLRFN
jgi:hypothetical protein